MSRQTFNHPNGLLNLAFVLHEILVWASSQFNNKVELSISTVLL